MWGWASPPLRLQQVAAGGPGSRSPAPSLSSSVGSNNNALAVAEHHRPPSSTSATINNHPRMIGEMVVDRAPSPARLSHTSEKHPRATLNELTVLRRHRELCDVVLNVGSRKIFAHRVILSACSPYFR